MVILGSRPLFHDRALGVDDLENGSDNNGSALDALYGGNSIVRIIGAFLNTLRFPCRIFFCSHRHGSDRGDQYNGQYNSEQSALRNLLHKVFHL